jgi:hypothetical protein
MLATWRKPVRFATDAKSNTFVLVTVILAAVAVMAEMTVPQPHHGGVSADLPKSSGQFRCRMQCEKTR